MARGGRIGRRALTGARCGVIVAFGEDGALLDPAFSGHAPEQERGQPAASAGSL